MESIQSQDILGVEAEDGFTSFGKPPLPWQLRNNWVTPKRKRKSRKIEIDLWAGED